MTVYDIQYVTKSVLALIEQAFKIAGISSGNKVFPEPPSRIGSGKDGVGFFLYHVQENAYYKNLLPLGKDDAGTRFTPMALNLYRPDDRLGGCRSCVIRGSYGAHANLIYYL